MPLLTMENMSKVITIDVESGDALLTHIRDNFPDFAFACGGNHKCGKCLVKVEGDCSSMSAEERALITVQDSMRLACFVKLVGDCYVELPNGDVDQKIEESFSSRIDTGVPLYTKPYGIAVDVGTTTIVAYLFKKDGQIPEHRVGVMNAQKIYGADVISRIVYANEHSVEELQQVTLEQLDELFLTLCERESISTDLLDVVCVTGNTTMLHILNGLDPRSLAEAPFLIQSRFGDTRCLPLKHFFGIDVYYPPCLSAYVGADVLCSILASPMMDSNKTTLLIDVGTNGELALYHEGRVLCCSTAAGPAFEGASISSGMLAQEGAIDAVWVENGTLSFSIIGDLPASGICGSGLIDAVSSARKAGLLDAKGRPQSENLYIGESGVSLTRADLNALYMAKSAIRAGVETLLHDQSLSEDEVEQVILCGGFGNYIKPGSAVGIGMLPGSFADKTISIGNAAGAGASMLLQNVAKKERIEALVSQSEVLELSYNPYFFQQFIEHMRFPDDDKGGLGQC